MLLGCKTSYDVTLSNGSKNTGVSKPLLDRESGHYRFKMIDGREMRVLSSRVILIEPHGESSEVVFQKPKPKK